MLRSRGGLGDATVFWASRAAQGQCGQPQPDHSVRLQRGANGAVVTSRFMR